MDLLTVSIVFASGIGISIFAVVFGGTLFLSLPLFQILFPELTLGAIIGNIKLGSVLRNATALTKLRHLLDRQTLSLVPILCLGSVLGSWQIASVSQVVVPAVLLLGLLVTEYSNRLRLPRALFWLVAFLVGLYGGIFGAGIMLLLQALLQLHHHDWLLLNIAHCDYNTIAVFISQPRNHG